ncbi:hypothetical protein [Martelella alba]|uniref:D-isomer specific 2-hydroxyacid dehydrogenase catalytic domain-containing protein n=1 Tax=Martelella alba TaxID=2590451 RepID=A0ABY2SQQ6_9HYPH|nr:hypothetical protein [Martelella alba]TKI07818.1 hypothetical protein FCN80_05110 [Martelella alba]
MRFSLPKHPILLCAPLTDAATERLQCFFQVAWRHSGAARSREGLADALSDKAAVLLTERDYLDADMLGRLPMLRAVCVLGRLHPDLDVPALTRQGIPLTLVPLEDGASGQDSLPAQDAAAQLIASLGFGRDGWHPTRLVNPDVSCCSCC